VNMRTSAQRLNDGLRKHLQTRLAEAATKAGRRLSAAEETAVATAASSEYLNTKDESLRRYLFPGGTSGGDGIEGGKVEQPGAPQAGGNAPRTPPPGRRFSQTPTVTSSNLDNVDLKALQRGDVVLQRQSTQQEIMRVLQGQPPSAAVQRAARAAGLTPGAWLLRQAVGYPGMLDPAAERMLQQRSSRGTAAGQKISSSSRPGNPYMQAGSWVTDVLLGVRPAMASSGGGRDGSLPFTGGAIGAAARTSPSVG